MVNSKCPNGIEDPLPSPVISIRKVNISERLNETNRLQISTWSHSRKFPRYIHIISIIYRNSMESSCWIEDLINPIHEDLTKWDQEISMLSPLLNQKISVNSSAKALGHYRNFMSQSSANGSSRHLGQIKTFFGSLCYFPDFAPLFAIFRNYKLPNILCYLHV